MFVAGIVYTAVHKNIVLFFLVRCVVPTYDGQQFYHPKHI